MIPVHSGLRFPGYKRYNLLTRFSWYPVIRKLHQLPTPATIKTTTVQFSFYLTPSSLWLDLGINTWFSHQSRLSIEHSKGVHLNASHHKEVLFCFEVRSKWVARAHKGSPTWLEFEPRWWRLEAHCSPNELLQILCSKVKINLYLKMLGALF